MSFETGTATGVGDLLVKWFNFLQANGWTADVDYSSDGQSPAFGVIQRKQDLASPLGSDPQNEVNLHSGFAVGDSDSHGDSLNIIPMRDYSSGEPQDAVEVATAGVTYTAISGLQHIRTSFPTTPFETYWFFESDFYAHAVVEYSSGFFRHFGMGQLNKMGKWFGGEYYYGHFWNQGASFIENSIYQGHTCGLDSATNLSQTNARIYGKLLDKSPFPDVAGRQSPESAWHGLLNSGDAGSGAGNAFDQDGRDIGGLMGNGPRIGPHHVLYQQGRIPFNGYRPMYPITVWTWYTGSNPDNMYMLGTQPDVRALSMEGNLLPGDEFTIGSDTWVAFPVARRREIQVLDDTEQSGLFGLAYKKVLT